MVKPRLRGWFHLGMAPLLQLAGLILIVAAPSPSWPASASPSTSWRRPCCSARRRSTTAATGARRWAPSSAVSIHTNIFLFIAGTYTPLALMLLTGASRVTVLTLAWGIAAVGITVKMGWMNAPRWFYTALYLAMGWVAVGWLPAFWAAGGPLVVILIAAGGLIYSAGAVVYALKRPNPSPTWFGFHEIFHACTILAAICHFVAIALVTLT